eukprot:312559_1
MASTTTTCILFIAVKLVSVVCYNTWVDSVTNSQGVFRLYKNDRIEHISGPGNNTPRNATTLVQQDEGNLVLYHNGKDLWSSVTGIGQANAQGNYTQLNMDGNLQVIERGKTTIAWQTATTGHDNGKPHTLVVAYKCVYIMDRNGNIFWIPSWGINGLDCSIYGLDLVIHHATQSRPVSSTFFTPTYGYAHTYTPHHMLDQGRINAVYDWGIALGDMTNGDYKNTLYIRDWNADRLNGSAMIMGNGSSNVQPIGCEPFILNDKDYIIGYQIYDSFNYVHGITFYTALGCAYQCFGEADTGIGSGQTITNSGIISYYYAMNDFWYLSGFKGVFGSIIHTLTLQFTKLPDDANLTTSDKLMCHITSSPTSNPTIAPTSDPTSSPTGSTDAPTLKPTSNPIASTDLPTANPTHAPTLYPTDTPSSRPTFIPTHVSITQFTLHLEDKTTTEIITTEIVSSQPNTANNYSAMIVVSCIAVIVLVGIFIVKYLHDKKEKIPEKQEVEVKKVEIAHVERANDDIHNPTHPIIMQWLTDEVHLPQYLECFVQNGYDKMVFIRDIADKNQLKEIGIEKSGHQTRILAQIQLLQGKEKGEKDVSVTSVIGYTNEGYANNEKRTFTVPSTLVNTIDGNEINQFETNIGMETDGFDPDLPLPDDSEDSIL